MEIKEIDYVDRQVASDDLKYGAHWKDSVCETLRVVHDVVFESRLQSETKGLLTRLLTDAFVQATKMAIRLAYYRDTYGDITGNEGKNIIKIPNVEERRKIRNMRRGL